MDSYLYNFKMSDIALKLKFMMLLSVLQISRSKRDNLGIILHITPLKHML